MKPILPLRWRIEAKSNDGKTVVLGKYVTEAEAETDKDKFVAAGYYRKVLIVPIPERPAPEPLPPIAGAVAPPARPATH